MQQSRTHHGSQGERNESRNQNSHTERNCEFPEEAADDIAHEEKRNQNRDQRNRQRHDGETDLLGTLEGRLHRTFTLFNVAHDVFDHYDRVIHHKTRRNRERHQREVVKTVARDIHHAESAHKRKRHGDAWDNRGREISQKKKDHHHHQRDGQHQFEFNILYGGSNRGGAVRQHGHFYRGRQAGL